MTALGIDQLRGFTADRQTRIMTLAYAVGGELWVAVVFWTPRRRR